jgi:hypothetical protein
MNWFCFVVGFVAVFFGEASTCGMPDGKHVHDVAPYGEEDAILSVSLAVKQNPDFFAVGIGIRVDGAAWWLRAERGDL